MNANRDIFYQEYGTEVHPENIHGKMQPTLLIRDYLNGR